MISDAISALKAQGFKFAHFAWSHAPEGDYGTWGEDTATEFTVGNTTVEQVLNGYVDYFTRDDSDAPRLLIQSAMTGAGVVWHLDAVQYESDTGYIHYSWSYYEHG